MAIEDLETKAELHAWIEQQFPILTGTVEARIALLYQGNGSPENVVVANTGAIYQRLDGGAGTSFYCKETDDGLNSGWTAK